MANLYINGQKSDDKKIYVEAIKLAAGSVQYKQLPIQKTMLQTIEQLNNYYSTTKEKHYLEVAVLHIQAYLEMGFPYENGAPLFSKILDSLGLKEEAVLLPRKYAQQKIRLSKSAIRSMIKKWQASPRQKMKIDEVVEDILTKALHNVYGIFYYENTVTNELYELIINEKEQLFHDVQRGIFYTFQK